MDTKNNINRFNLLLEYSIKKGSTPEADSYYTSSSPKLNLQEDDPEGPEGAEPQGYAKEEAPATPPAADNGASAADSMFPPADNMEASGTDEAIPDMDGGGTGPEAAAEVTPEADPAEEKEDILADIVRVQHEKIESLLAFAQNTETRISQAEAEAGMVPSLQAQIENLMAKIKALTPPTPLESLGRVAKASGGITIQDYWNDYLEKKGSDERLEVDPYYQDKTQKDEAGALYIDKKNIPGMGDDEARRSFRPI